MLKAKKTNKKNDFSKSQNHFFIYNYKFTLVCKDKQEDKYY